MPDPTSCSPTGKPWFTHAVRLGPPVAAADGERAEQDLQSGDRAAASRLAVTLQRMTWGLGYVPEQVWEDPNIAGLPIRRDPATASIGFPNGKAAGSATPLIWGQAQYVRLVLDLKAGTLLDQPTITRARYLDPQAPTVGTGDDRHARRRSERDRRRTTTVTGTTTPGALVQVALVSPDPHPTPPPWWRPSPTHTAVTRPRSRPRPHTRES